jgi:nitroreductase
MNVEEAILGRRATRKFTDDKIDKNAIDKILEAGVWAPSGGNSQSRVFIVIADAERIAAIRDFSSGMAGIPQLIIVMGTDTVKAKESGGENWEVSSTMDVAMAAENMMLRAFDLGIGSCPILSFDREKLMEQVSASPDIHLNLLVTFGVPAYVGEAPRRSTAQVFYDVMGIRYDGTIKEMVKSQLKSSGRAAPETVRDLISFCIFSARSLAKEPADYATFRLMEVAGRLLDSYSNPDDIKNFKEVKERLDRLRFGKMVASEELAREVEAIVQLL